MTAPSQTFAPARFSTESLNPADRLAYYIEVVSRTVGGCEIDPLDEHFRCDVEAYPLPEFGVVRVTSSSLRVRTPAAPHSADVMGLMMFKRVNCSVTQRGREVSTSRPGAVLFSSDPMTIERSASELLVIGISRKVLAPLISDIDRAVMSFVPSDTGAMRLLVNYIDLVTSSAATLTPELGRAAANHCYDLVALAFGATRDAGESARRRGLPAARLAAIKSDILTHMTQPGFSVAAVAARNGISESYIRKLFETDATTFTDFVRGQRLARAHRMLADSRYGSRSITSIAFDCGFDDVSYFNRCFRRCYDMTPSDVRALSRREPSDPERD